jgi:hypothetical protein
MIQRIQSIYLLVATLAMALISFKIPVWTLNEQLVMAQDDTKMFILTLTAMILSGLGIFLFKNRKLQMKLIRLDVLVLMIISVRLFLLLKNDELNLTLNTNCIALFLVAFATLLLAYRAVKKDDDLVKSVDRIR